MYPAPGLTTDPFVVRVPPDLVSVLAEAVDDLKVDEPLRVVPRVRDVELRLVGRDAVHEVRPVHRDGVLLRGQRDGHGRCGEKNE